MMNIKTFVQEFKDKKIMNNKINEHAVSDFIKSKLEIKTYLPFQQKREIAQIIVDSNTEIIDGVKKNHPVDQYLSFVMAAITAHTDLESGDNPVEDYDLLAESGLLEAIIAEFQNSYNELDALTKMILASELEYNSVGNILGRFLDGVLKKLSGAEQMFKNVASNFNEEDLAKLSGFLDTYIK